MEHNDGLTKETVVLNDGRYLIYYDFHDEEDKNNEANPPNSQEERTR